MTFHTRQFIRHPTSIPLEFSVGSLNKMTQAKDAGEGGLCFESQHPINTGEPIRISIPISVPKCVVNGIVRWCKQDDTMFLVGVAFQEESVAFQVKMIEQICQIENYRKRLKAEKGLTLTSEQAAEEWIELYASEFPQISS